MRRFILPLAALVLGSQVALAELHNSTWPTWGHDYRHTYRVGGISFPTTVAFAWSAPFGATAQPTLFSLSPELQHIVMLRGPQLAIWDLTDFGFQFQEAGLNMTPANLNSVTITNFGWQWNWPENELGYPEGLFVPMDPCGRQDTTPFFGAKYPVFSVNGYQKNVFLFFDGLFYNMLPLVRQGAAGTKNSPTVFLDVFDVNSSVYPVPDPPEVVPPAMTTWAIWASDAGRLHVAMERIDIVIDEATGAVQANFLPFAAPWVGGVAVYPPLNLQWRQGLRVPRLGSTGTSPAPPAVNQVNQRVYVAGHYGDVRCLGVQEDSMQFGYPAPDILWTNTLTTEIDGNEVGVQTDAGVSLGKDGTLYVVGSWVPKQPQGVFKTRLWALDPETGDILGDGTKFLDLDGMAVAPPAIGYVDGTEAGDEMLYIATMKGYDLVNSRRVNGRLYAVNAVTFEILWSKEYTSYTRVAPLVDAESRVVLGDDAGLVHCYDRDGSDLWEVRTPSGEAVSTGPIATVDSQGLPVIIITTNRNIYGLKPPP